MYQGMKGSCPRKPPFHLDIVLPYLTFPETNIGDCLQNVKAMTNYANVRQRHHTVTSILVGGSRRKVRFALFLGMIAAET